MSQLVNRAAYQKEPIALGRNGKAEAYLVSAEDFRRIRRDPKEELLSPESKAFFAYLAGKYHLSLIVLFGSRAKGNFVRPESDIDLAIQPEKEVDSDTEQKIYGELASHFHWDAIDLINLGRQSNVVLRYNIFNEGKILFQKYPELFNEMRLAAWFEYQDFQPYLAMQKDLILKRLETLNAES